MERMDGYFTFETWSISCCFENPKEKWKLKVKGSKKAKIANFYPTSCWKKWNQIIFCNARHVLKNYSKYDFPTLLEGFQHILSILSKACIHMILSGNQLPHKHFMFLSSFIASNIHFLQYISRFTLFNKKKNKT